MSVNSIELYTQNINTNNTTETSKTDENKEVDETQETSKTQESTEEDEQMSLELDEEQEEEQEEQETTNKDLAAMLTENQLNEAELLQQQYMLTITQIQQSIKDAQQERRNLCYTTQNSALNGEGKVTNVFSEYSSINATINKLSNQLFTTIAQYQVQMNQLAAQAGQTALQLQALGQTNNLDLNELGVNGTNNATNMKITSNLDGSTEEIDALIEKYSNEAGLDPNFVKAVVKAESGFNPQATSSAGAQGLMQLMPQTAAGKGVTDAYDPEQNIKAGVELLKEFYDTYGDYNLALAAYNAGPGNVEEYDGIPPFEETQSYIEIVNKYWEEYKNS